MPVLEKPRYDTVGELLDDWMAATRRGDLDAVLACYAPDVRAFDAIGEQQYDGLEAYAAHWRRCFSMVHGEMIFEPHDLRTDSAGDLALVHYLARCGCEGADGALQVGWMRASVCLRRAGGEGWRIVHEHYSMPMDPETNQAVMGGPE
ncbi:YybH family protein [Maricaulis sp. CAU 1757]